MASQKKVQWAQLRIGILAAVAMVIAGVLIFLLTGQSNLFERRVPSAHLSWKIRPAWRRTLRCASTAFWSGHIGTVRLSGSRDPKRTVEIDMVIPEKYLDQIPEDSKAAISAANLLGDKYINITKGTHPKHVEDGRRDCSRSQTQDIPEILAQSSGLLSQFQTILGRVGRPARRRRERAG